MINLWKTDKDWANGYASIVIGIIRKHAGKIINIEPTDGVKDILQATDFIVKAEMGDIACRIRRPEYLERFGDFTIRHSRPTGTSTELEKIKAGFARWSFYAWAVSDKSSDGFKKWLLVDLNRLRESGLLDERKPIPNPDGTSFIAISIPELVIFDCIVESGGLNE